MKPDADAHNKPDDRRMRILVVDDIPENLYLLERTLESRGYEVVTAANGVEGLQRLREQQIDAVVSDVMMPNMDGFEFCHNIKIDPVLKEVPFVFYTATFTDPQDEAFAYSLGANAFVPKPVETEEFVRQLQKTLNHAASTPPRQISRQLTDSQLAYFREYSARLVHKLQDKIHEAEDANARLRQLNETLEARVQEKTALLQASNEELQAFAGSVSHDLRAPLRAIQSFAEILVEEYGATLPSEARDYLARIVQSGSRMERMILDFLTYSRTTQPDLKLDRVDLDLLTREIVQVNPAFNRPKADVQIEAPLLPVTANAVALNQCITNLVSNAVKFVRPGTTPRVRIRTERINGSVRLWIEDNGIGIPPDLANQIFKPFERLHSAERYEGTGLGLVIVRKAVERMGGRVGVESNHENGSRFWLDLPPA